VTGQDALAKFAEGRGLAFSKTAELPEQGSTLSRDSGRVEGAATGALPGGIEGTLAHFTYTYTWTDSDNDTHTETRRFTLVVTRIPESIGFLPYFGFSGRGSNLSPTAGGEEMEKVDLGDAERLKDSSAYVYKGTSKNWLMQLLSPAMLDWLARSDDGFGFELADGVLCAGRDGYTGDPATLTTICEDAAHVATAIREESMEEVGTGGADTEAAKNPKAADAQMEAALREVAVEPPPDLTAAVSTFRSHVRSSPYTLFRALRFGALLTLVLNIPGAAVPIVLSVQGEFALLAAIEVGLLLIFSFFAFRSRVRDCGTQYAEEAFYRAYAKGRELKLEEPLHFAATHAEAKLPFKPDRVLTGPLPGGPTTGSLVLSGDGSKRADRIAVVAGPKGPVAEAELRADPPPLSAKTLDSYAERLTKELTAAATAK
jgi:hypothetical protein